MFSDAKWARYVGERGRPGMEGPPPDELHVVGAEFTHLASQGVPAVLGVPCTAFSLTLLIVPGGAIAPGATLAQMPSTQVSKSVTAAGLDPLDFFFAPGVYRWSGSLISKAALASQALIGLAFAARGTGPIGTVASIPGSSGPWRQEFWLGQQNAPNQPFEGRMYIPKEWTAFVYVSIGLAVSDNAVWRCEIWPEYVFDEAGST